MTNSWRNLFCSTEDRTSTKNARDMPALAALRPLLCALPGPPPLLAVSKVDRVDDGVSY
jgi:hypothetical protein